MTSRSHKKPRTIHRSRPVSIVKIAGAALLCTISAPAAHLDAQSPRVVPIPVAPRENVVQLIGLEDAEPLEELKQRSPQERWDELQRQAPPRATAKPLPPDVDGVSLPALPSESSEIPMLPDVDGLGEFDAFSSPPREVPTRVVSQPAEPPVTDYDSQQLPPPEEESTLPDVVRSLDAIEPYRGFKGTRHSAGVGDATETANLEQVPEDRVFPEGEYEPRLSPDTVFSWEASNLWHNPLYFEDPALERYGHVAHPLIQPFCSAGKFTAQLIGLPYQSTIDSPCRRRYTLGWLRPGECAPYKIYQVPLNRDAALVEAGAVTGAFFIFP